MWEILKIGRRVWKGIPWKEIKRPKTEEYREHINELRNLKDRSKE